MIELGKQYRTRDGGEVRIYAVDGHGDDAVHGACKTGTKWDLMGWKSDGRWLNSGECSEDLIEVKPTITRTYWLVHWKAGHASAWDASDIERYRTLADPPLAITGPHEITFTEGEGLSE